MAPVIVREAARPDADGLIEYVVVFVDRVTAADAANLSRQIAQRLNLRAITPFNGPALNGFSAKMEPATVARLRSEPSVRFIEQSLPLVPWDLIRYPPSWGQDRIDQRPAPLNQKLEIGWVIRPVAIYVVDSGIYSGHYNLGALRFHPGICTVPGCTSAPAESLVDTFGHGTYVAATIGGSRHGVSKDVDVYSVRVYTSPPISPAATLQGINWIVSHPRPRKIVNISFGVEGGTSLALDTAVQNMINAGISVVVSAGNENADACLRSPSRVLDAIVVGATEKPVGATESKASYSNWGSCVDLFAPGHNIMTANIGSPSAEVFKSGTSMAAPHVTGVAALYAAQNLTPLQIQMQLLQDATTTPITSAAGSPNRMLYLKGMSDGRAKGPLLALTAPGGLNPMFGVKDDGQVFIVYNDTASGLLQVGNITNVKVFPGSLALGQSGDDIWGVRKDGNLEHFWWRPSPAGWQSETVQVWGGGADPTSLVSTGQGNPVFGIKTTGQVFLVWRDVNAWGVGNIRDVTAQFGSLRLAKDGSLFGVRPDANIFHAWWNTDGWWEVSINVW
jgi:subtilase family protein